VNNAVKHAPGAPITVTLSRADPGVRLSVRNPLAGHTAADPREGGAGIGLHIMRHRAQLIHARPQAGPEGRDWHVTVHWEGGPLTARGGRT
jgi:nitrate/nitrite-specific signal transduction histidine kinase